MISGLKLKNSLVGDVNKFEKKLTTKKFSTSLSDTQELYQRRILGSGVPLVLLAEGVAEILQAGRRRRRLARGAGGAISRGPQAALHLL